MFKELFLFEPDIIARVCEESGLMSVGTLILEEYIINSNTEITRQVKRAYGDDVDVIAKYWIKLAE